MEEIFVLILAKLYAQNKRFILKKQNDILQIKQ